MTAATYALLTIIWTCFAVVAFMASIWQLIARFVDRAVLQQHQLSSMLTYRYDVVIRASITYTALSLYFILQGWSQLSFPPVSPHAGNNILRAGGTVIVTLLIIGVNWVDGRKRASARTQFEDHFIEEVRKVATEVVEVHDRR